MLALESKIKSENSILLDVHTYHLSLVPQQQKSRFLFDFYELFPASEQYRKWYTRKVLKYCPLYLWKQDQGILGQLGWRGRDTKESNVRYCYTCGTTYLCSPFLPNLANDKVSLNPCMAGEKVGNIL